MMEGFLKRLLLPLWVLMVLGAVPGAHGADSLITIGANASITTTSGADVCADSRDIDPNGLFDGSWCGGPLMVELLSFTVQGQADCIVLGWETAAEVDCAGFHLWRSKTNGGEYTRITQTLIAAEGGPTSGVEYGYEDFDVELGLTHYYQLQVIDYSGQDTFHGPISAWAGVVDIKANKSDGPVVVLSDTPVSVSVDLNPGECEGQSSDLWIAVNTPFAPPFDWYTFSDETGWRPGIHLWVQTPLLKLSSPVEVLKMPLSSGVYNFYFGVDDPDNAAAGPWLGLDSVTVEVR